MVKDTAVYDRWRADVRSEWTSDVTIAGWRTWFAKADQAGRGVTDALLTAAAIVPGMHILDIASGSGTPAFALAAAVGPHGHVTATDLSAGMLAAAERHARQMGVTNIAFQEADAERLPFADASFDCVTCRWGIMYVADVEQGLAEIRRVLKPGGRAAFAVWGPLDQNPLFQLFAPLMRRMTLPEPEPGAPSPLRYAEAGTLAAALRDGGFQGVTEAAVATTYAWSGTPEELQVSELELAGPILGVLEGLPSDERAAALAEMLVGYRRYADERGVNVPMMTIIAVGVR